MAMNILVSIKSILSGMALLNVDPTLINKLKSYCYNLLYTVPLLALLFPLIAYFYANLANITKATDAFYVIAATVMCIGQYWSLVIEKTKLAHLLLRLQYLVNESM